jgi:hypothetical protein
MRRTPRNLADAREELVQIQEEFVRPGRVTRFRADAHTRNCGDQRPAFSGLAEEELIEFTIMKLKCHLIGNGSRF